MEIEYFEVQSNPEGNITHKDIKILKEGEKPTGAVIKGLKSLSFESKTHPEITIENLTLCEHENDYYKDVDIKLAFNIEITRDELFSLMAGLKDMGELFRAESFPIKITMETDLDKINKQYWKKVEEQK